MGETFGGEKGEEFTFPDSCKFIFCSPKIKECRVISGVAAETKDSCLMPKFFSYHVLAAGMDLTVRTKWSRDVILAAGWFDAILIV